MKSIKLIIFLFSLCLSFLYGQETQKLPKDGAVKFVFLDNKKEEIAFINCTITYNNNVKVNRFLTPASSESSRIVTRAGIYTFYIHTKDYKNVIISEVEVWNDKTTYLNIVLTPKVSKKDNDTVKIKWLMPTIDKDYPQQ